MSEEAVEEEEEQKIAPAEEEAVPWVMVVGWFCGCWRHRHGTLMLCNAVPQSAPLMFEFNHNPSEVL
jgi:hypothetical protein